MSKNQPYQNKDFMFPTTGAVKRRRFAVVDIETKDGDSQKAGFTRPFLAGYYDGIDFFATRGADCLASMLDFLLTNNNLGMSYYAHSGGSFDWLHFLSYITALGYDYEIIPIQSKIQVLKVFSKIDKKSGWEFIDSYQLIPAKLEKVSSMFGGGVTKMKFDLDTDENHPDWEKYLELDCKSLFHSLVKFYELVETELGGEVGITTAATSMKTFRRNYQKSPITRHVKYHDFFREAYYGGRVEIFREYAEALNYYDINSSYPYAMLQKMPVGKLTKYFGTPPEWLQTDRIGFARVKVDMPESVYLPVLPYRSKEEKKLIFPVGKFEGVWPAIEIFAAIEQGAKVEWLNSVWIESENIFEDMVHKVYRYRDKSLPSWEEAMDYVAKIMLNSLYGKFATNVNREKIVRVKDNEFPPDGSFPVNTKSEDNELYIVEEEIDAPYIIPQISAHITAIARLTLHKFITLGHEMGILAYCDTDSILTSADLSKFVGSGLGNLKDEGKGVKYKGTFLQPKLYFLEGDDGSEKVVMKGYHNRNRKSFELVKQGESLSYSTLEKLGSMKARGFKDGPRMVDIKRAIRKEDTKRRHIQGITYPIIIDNELEEVEDDE